MNFEKFFALIKENGGASYNPTTGELNPTTGYMVALSGHEVVLDRAQFGPISLAAYVRRMADHLSPITFVGAWIDEGKVYLDLSENVQDKFRACTIGILRDQKAVWDCEKKESIYLPSPQKAGTSFQQRTYAEMKAREIAR